MQEEINDEGWTTHETKKVKSKRAYNKPTEELTFEFRNPNASLIVDDNTFNAISDGVEDPFDESHKKKKTATSLIFIILMLTRLQNLRRRRRRKKQNNKKNAFPRNNERSNNLRNNRLLQHYNLKNQCNKSNLQNQERRRRRKLCKLQILIKRQNRLRKGL